MARKPPATTATAPRTTKSRTGKPALVVPAKPHRNGTTHASAPAKSTANFATDAWPYAPALETVNVDIAASYGHFIGGKFAPSIGGGTFPTGAARIGVEGGKPFDTFWKGGDGLIGSTSRKRKDCL